MEHPQQNLLTEFEQPLLTYVVFWPRFGALLLDGILLTVFNLLFHWILPEKDNIALILALGCIPFLYHLILEYRYGATLGKMALGIQIVNYELMQPRVATYFQA